jgi:transposase
VGPNPTDRARCGSKLNVMADAAGTPLSVIVSAANEHDVNFILPLVFTKFPSIGGAIGRPRTQPQSVCADAGYTSKDVLEVLTKTNISAEIPQRGSDSPEGLGQRRWPIERTIAWLKQFRRVGIRRDRKVHIYEAFVEMACSMIAFRKLNTI